MSEPYFSLVPLEDLFPNAYNARRFDENMTPQRRARFEELVASVIEKGIIEPLLVRPVDGRFEVIAGERRYRAALRAANRFGASTGYVVPCMVREVGDDEAFDLMVIENLQREDLTPMETAQAFKAYLDRYGNTADTVAEITARTGIPTHAIRRQVRLLELPAEILAAWREGSITQSHVEKFVGIHDRAQQLELLAACVRSKLSVRELAERIGAVCPDLDRGLFDKAECQVCCFNTSVQSSLFPDASGAGKCGNAACFEAKQEAFLTEKWPQGKAAATFGTRGFRFGHRLGNEHREQILGDTAGRCLECDAFVTVIRLTGAVVSGYERVCVGPRPCFEELYRGAQISTVPAETAADNALSAPETAAAPVEQSSAALQSPTPAAAQERPTGPTGPKSPTSPTSPKSQTSPTATRPAEKPAAKTPPPEETGPVFNAARGERHRQLFLKLRLQAHLKDYLAEDSTVMALALLALTTASLPARKAIDAHFQLGTQTDTCVVAERTFALDAEDINEALRLAAVAHLVEHPALQPAVRQIAAGHCGVRVADWSPTRAYLQELGKSEIVRIGEEQGVDIWSDEKVKAYRQQHFGGRALLALKKEDLIDVILGSGADLVGRVPAEVLGKKG